MQRMDKDKKTELLGARVKRSKFWMPRRNAIDLRPDFPPVKALPLDVIEPFGRKLDVLHGHHPDATKLVRGASDHLNDVIIHNPRKMIGELRGQPMGQQFRHGGEDLNVSTVRGHVVQSPLHVARARIDFAARFGGDPETRPAGFVHLQRRPESMTGGQIDQGVRHDVCMDIDYGQLGILPRIDHSYYKKYRYKIEKITFIDVGVLQWDMKDSETGMKDLEGGASPAITRT